MDVSAAQTPHRRPHCQFISTAGSSDCVEGKAGTLVEFGAKFSASCVDGNVFLDHLDWDNFSESAELPQQVEQFGDRFGHYRASVHADQIYRTRANRAYCGKHGIRLSGKPLDKPVVNDQAEVRNQAQEDARVRNQIEGKFGQGKRRFCLNRVTAKLASTAQTAITITFWVINLERLLRQLLFVFFGLDWLAVH